MDRQSGSTSIPILIVLIAFSLLAVGMLFLIQGFSRYTLRSRETFRAKRELIEKAEEIVALLFPRDPDEADSPHDPIFSAVEKMQDIEVTLEDVSSYLGLNWARKGLLTASDLLRDSEASARELQQHREDTGLYLDLEEGYSSFFKEDVVLEEHFTAYSYFNINVCDEFVLRKLFEIRTGDKVKSEIFRLKIHNHRLKTKEKSFIQPDELSGFLGLDSDIVYPVVNAEPVINVNFAPRSVLLTVLIASGIEKADETVSSILQSREDRPLDLEALEFILGKALKETPVGQYLGYRTWFWRLRVSLGGNELTWIIARVPPDSGTGGASDDCTMRLVEESYSL
jgi:hypothetical protein